MQGSFNGVSGALGLDRKGPTQSGLRQLLACGGAQMTPFASICSVKRAANITHTPWSHGLNGDNPCIMRRTRGPHRWPPSLETLDHMLGASRRPGRQSRPFPPPQRDPRPAAFPPCGPRAALGPARVPPAQRPLAALGARPTSGFVCCPGRPGGAPRPRPGRPRGSLRPAAWSRRAPDQAAG